jgi:tetratricopeptide (TPR) repeat protein
MRRALAIDETSFGGNHTNVAIRLNNLAALLRATNRLADAEPMYRRALAIDEKNFGADHPRVAIGLNNLAQQLQDTSRLAEAEPLAARAVRIVEASLPEHHPWVQTFRANLASIRAALPSPLAGEGRVGGECADLARAGARTPTPDPSPQGGGGGLAALFHFVFGARPPRR